jgi:hypothetical protein
MRMRTKALMMMKMTRTRSTTRMMRMKKRPKTMKTMTTKTTKTTKTTRPKLMTWTSGARPVADGIGEETAEIQARKSLHPALILHQRRTARDRDRGRDPDRIHLEAQSRARAWMRAQGSETHLHRPYLLCQMANRDAGHLPKRRLARLHEQRLKPRTRAGDDGLRTLKKVIAHHLETGVIASERGRQAPRRRLL